MSFHINASWQDVAVLFVNPYQKKITEGMGLVFQLVFKTSSGRIKSSVAGSIPALSAIYFRNSLIINGENQ